MEHSNIDSAARPNVGGRPDVQCARSSSAAHALATQDYVDFEVLVAMDASTD
jgi:hypothetical protein